ncbi:MAG: hypothetical protein ACI9OJ_002324 [Myxococcota bacterium]|jgi:hypothetical protein
MAAVLLVYSRSQATTLGPLVEVRCPVDDTHFHVRFAKSQLRAPLGEFVRLPSPERIHQCPKCGWVGTRHDLVDVTVDRPSTNEIHQSAALLASPRWVSSIGSTRDQLWMRLQRSAELAAIRHRDPRDIAWRYLQAAGQAPISGASDERHRLVALAQTYLARAPLDDHSSRYAAAELARQLCDSRFARTELKRLATAVTPSRPIAAWIRRALRDTERPDSSAKCKPTTRSK